MQRSDDARRLIEGRIAELVANQHGVIARCQLIELGLGEGAIAHRRRAGRYVLLYPGVYAVGHAQVSGLARFMAAVLAGGPGALLSHQSAAHHWEILLTDSAQIHVTTVSHRGRRLGSIVFHRTRELHPRDCTRRHGIPITAIPRTLLDLAESVPVKRLRRAYEQSERIGLFDLNALDDLIERSRGRHGLKPLIALTARCSSRDHPPVLKSDLEQRLRELCEDHRIPLPSFNVTVNGHDVDAYWPTQRLVVEVDGYEFHSGREVFESDRVKDNDHQLAGIMALRFTDMNLENESAVVARSILSGLRRALP